MQQLRTWAINGSFLTTENYTDIKNEVAPGEMTATYFSARKASCRTKEYHLVFVKENIFTYISGEKKE